MTVLFDTSVLLPALWEQHARHEEAREYLRLQISRNAVAVSAHTLAELYAGLTAAARYRPAEAVETVRWVRSTFAVQPLALYDYMEAIEDAADRGITGGGIYDALHARAASKAGASRIVHGDLRSYPRLWPASKLATSLSPMP